MLSKKKPFKNRWATGKKVAEVQNAPKVVRAESLPEENKRNCDKCRLEQPLTKMGTPRLAGTKHNANHPNI